MHGKEQRPNRNTPRPQPESRGRVQAKCSPKATRPAPKTTTKARELTRGVDVLGRAGMARGPKAQPAPPPNNNTHPRASRLQGVRGVRGNKTFPITKVDSPSGVEAPRRQSGVGVGEAPGRGASAQAGWAPRRYRAGNGRRQVARRRADQDLRGEYRGREEVRAWGEVCGRRGAMIGQQGKDGRREAQFIERCSMPDTLFRRVGAPSQLGTLALFAQVRYI